jgi:hypothetical protein
MSAVKRAVCEKCRKLVPAEHIARDGRVYVSKQCPDCGRTEALVSSDAKAWRGKRELWRYDPATARECLMNCRSCGRAHGPRMVFLDLTNRCNMNCPICIANIPGMGFEFHPPLEYFERVLDGLSKMEPRPTVQLFGGEPTLREDLFEIIAMAQEKGLRVRIVTNGLKLADEEFCKKLCEAGVPVLLAFDGRDPEIYARLRKNRPAYFKKLAALGNLKKYSKRKNTIMCCVARGINDKHMRDLVEFCHENRDYISHLHLIPLTETWEEGEFETDVTTTIEDVEQIIAASFPGEPVEFLPAGLGHHLLQAGSFFGNFRFTFGGVHPNCESATLFLSDGERYRPIGHYLKRPLHEVADEVIGRANKIDGKLARLNPERFLQRWQGRLIVTRTFAPVLLRSLDFKRIAKGLPVVAALKILAGLLVGKRLKDQVRKHLTVTDTLGMVVLPFEEYHSIDSERLQNCKAGFAFEDPDSGQVKVVPVCSYTLFRDDVERKIVARYGAVAAADTVSARK